MATTFIWKIDGLRVAQLSQPDSVTVVGWICEGTDGVNTAEISGSSEFTPVPGPGFIPFANLTLANVQGWVADELGPNGLISAEDCVKGQLESLATPPQAPTSKSMPWL
jgi:hypothetical protein